MKGDNVCKQKVTNFTLEILSFVEIDIKEIPLNFYLQTLK